VGSPALLRFARTKGRRASDEANAKRDMCVGVGHNLLNESSIDLTTSSARLITICCYNRLLETFRRPRYKPIQTHYGENYRQLLYIVPGLKKQDIP
jgi:hypothetical protein